MGYHIIYKNNLSKVMKFSDDKWQQTGRNYQAQKKADLKWSPTK